ncbi:MerR family transcriptional regulator [Paenibacillus aceris]|uniref:DNA-binding transcriptional MerR regulator n=1 Tax=Paenibacillus aceris TaxID=869555 RepID=A0ABS4HWY6_9BACL|nr:MerR family transcriptional regulator [Paenibacillus aceris]MBP1963060.1 DNA-binding transcriptional MerR regulator [Paenibacillus aceris]NHW38472.1 MerR family transcriptional regulator [Paenibacillus aceris]
MKQRYYHTNEFAKKTSVTVRTLQYYDKKGVISPSEHTQAGYRLYSNEDLVKMQHILALKYLGFSLSQIKILIQTGPKEFSAALQTQKDMLLEKRAQLDSILLTIEETEKMEKGGVVDYNSIVKIMEVMQMELKPEWVNKYLSPDERKMMRNLAVNSYSQEALKKLAGQEFVEESHFQYTQFRDELKRLVAANADPGSPEAQNLARSLTELNARRSQGDPEIIKGMEKAWLSFNAMPGNMKPQIYTLSMKEREFIKQACIIMYKPSAEY